jgi:hypothetical protein
MYASGNLTLSAGEASEARPRELFPYAQVCSFPLCHFTRAGTTSPPRGLGLTIPRLHSHVWKLTVRGFAQ